MGFPAMAEAVGIHEKSLTRMLGPKGNPTSDNLLAVIRVLAEQEKVRFTVKDVSRAKSSKAASSRRKAA
jgi:DNA-binding phage protein